MKEEFELNNSLFETEVVETKGEKNIEKKPARENQRKGLLGWYLHY